jgi:hypothetical protein
MNKTWLNQRLINLSIEAQTSCYLYAHCNSFCCILLASAQTKNKLLRKVIDHTGMGLDANILCNCGHRDDYFSTLLRPYWLSSHISLWWKKKNHLPYQYYLSLYVEYNEKGEIIFQSIPSQAPLTIIKVSINIFHIDLMLPDQKNGIVTTKCIYLRQ